MEKLFELPPLAIIALGVTLGIMWGARQFGLTSGANSSPQKSPASAEVAAVIVDPTALNNATAAVKDLTAELKAEREQQDNHVHMLCRRLEGLAEEMENLTRNIGALVIEFARSKR